MIHFPIFIMTTTNVQQLFNFHFTPSEQDEDQLIKKLIFKIASGETVSTTSVWLKFFKAVKLFESKSNKELTKQDVESIRKCCDVVIESPYVKDKARKLDALHLKASLEIRMLQKICSEKLYDAFEPTCKRILEMLERIKDHPPTRGKLTRFCNHVIATSWYWYIQDNDVQTKICDYSDDTELKACELWFHDDDEIEKNYGASFRIPPRLSQQEHDDDEEMMMVPQTPELFPRGK